MVSPVSIDLLVHDNLRMPVTVQHQQRDHRARSDP